MIRYIRAEAKYLSYGTDFKFSQRGEWMTRVWADGLGDYYQRTDGDPELYELIPGQWVWIKAPKDPA